MAELTDQQIAREEKFLEGIPRLNVGALFLPPIWGPAHGMWAALLFYPIWLFADNTVAFSLIGQPFAAHRAASRGVEKDAYLRRQRVWAAVSVVAGCAMIAGATYYNLAIRPTLGA